MKIFVTVGTTSFDSLIKFIDNNFDKEFYDITLQISEGKYCPHNFNYFRYSENIEQYYMNCNIVVTHAGAGSVYKLLELKKKIVIVPNMDRVDKHQMEIALYMSNAGYARMCVNFEQLHATIHEIMSTEVKEFKKEKFFAHFKINEIIRKLYVASMPEKSGLHE
jgi:UDP-N-acetylglucosamine transferase subunit ALG13